MSAYTDQVAARIAASLTEEQLDKIAVLLAPGVPCNKKPNLVEQRRAA